VSRGRRKFGLPLHFSWYCEKQHPGFLHSPLQTYTFVVQFIHLMSFSAERLVEMKLIVQNIKNCGSGRVHMQATDTRETGKL
jgi:hypothetical protein